MKRGQTRSLQARANRLAPEVVAGASRFHLRIDRSGIHGLGLFAEQAIPSGSKVIEYTGERISQRQMNKRLRRILERHGHPPRYVFRLNRYWCVDAEKGGSGAERVNHCCEPNLIARKVRDRIFLFSRRRICPGEELTLDYLIRRTIPLIACHCRSPKCRGTINLCQLPGK
jgi:SET domain-containing protein